MPFYRKKPVVIEAMQFGSTADASPIIDWILYNGGTARYHEPVPEYVSPDGKQGHSEILESIAIDTLEGTMSAMLGDYIIRGVHGEFYPCKPEIFAATYEPLVRGVH